MGKCLEIAAAAISRREGGGADEERSGEGRSHVPHDSSVEEHIRTFSIVLGLQVAKTEMIRKLKLHADT